MSRLLFIVLLLSFSFTVHAQQNKNVGTVTMQGESDDAIDPAADTFNKAEPEPVYYFVDKMPSYPGGIDKYVKKNMHCLAAVKDGELTLTFTVKKDGKLADVKITKGAGTACDEAAIKMLQTMPAWTPGVREGQTVLVSYRIKLHFEGSKVSVVE